MPLSPNYNPKDNETKIYSQWMDAKIGNPESQKTSNHPLVKGGQTQSGGIATHAILMPPPNLTGDLHAGHAFQHYLMDTLSRLARQRGEKNLWFPGVDHAGLQLEGVIDKLIKKGEFDEIIKATQLSKGVKVEDFGGIAKEDLPKYLKTNHPDLWLECAWSKVNLWRDNQKNQSAILGDTPDYDRSLFTLDPQNLEMVNYAFTKYWQDGLIYKGSYLVNWSVGLMTALSDVAGEIEYEKRVDPFVTFEYRTNSSHCSESWINLVGHELLLDKITYYFNFNPIFVSTVRPETIFGDVAIALHPDILKNKLILNNFTQNEINTILEALVNGDIEFNFGIECLNVKNLKLILAEEVDPNFGSGSLKITPANDIVDYEIFNKYIGGDFESAIGRDGKLTEICGEFAGQTVNEGRANVIKKLIENGFVPKKEKNNGATEAASTKPNSYFGIEFAEGINPEDYQIDWNYEHNVTICERTKTVVEPLISEEFFISYHKEFNWAPIAKDLSRTITNKGKKTNLQKLGIEAVNATNFHSPEYKERGINFLENIKDWCISRDLIWGHKMPVWYNLDLNPDRKFYSYEELNLLSGNKVVEEPPYQGAGGTAVKKMQLPINMKLVERAKEMSKNMTTSEKILWDKVLSSKKTGSKWIKQHIVGSFILDFFCFELGLCIEVDGETHIDNNDYDKSRTDFLNLAGIKVVRYNNLEVQNNIEGVGVDILNKIREIQQSASTPQPPVRGSRNSNNHFAISVTQPTTPGNWVQEEKILDTWFSSCLWPLSTLKYPEFVKQNYSQGNMPLSGAGSEADWGTNTPKPNLIFLGGGDVFETEQDYKQYLKDSRVRLDSTTTRGWRSQLQADLQPYNIEIIAPRMPSKDNAKYQDWKIIFDKLLPFINPNSILVGHSLGGSFLLNYLSENELKVNSLHLLGTPKTGCFDFDTTDFSKLQYIDINIYHSKDDFVVDYNEAIELKKVLPTANFNSYDNYNHFLIPTFPELTANILKSLSLKNSQLEGAPNGDTEAAYTNPISTSDFSTFYPTQEMTTGKDIFYQWIVRMTTLSYYFTAQIPYENLVITPTILDDKGKKMSKSLGNGMDPVAQINKYSSDAMRMAMLGGMIPDRNIKMGGRLADELCEKYRNFGNKMWNIARFFEYQEGKENIEDK
jgi:valyl-tRNA synthetase/predicted alpha/beta hydrolase family esterase